jgi:DNA (cytosine-5)-methyltransferase 1
LASRLGPIEVPASAAGASKAATVKTRIGNLRPIEAGGQDPADPLHTSRALTAINLERIRASTPGGTWEDWPKRLLAPCHRRSTGATFRNVYARMEWDKPSPTITTLAYNFGTGRFGHPDQDRPISLREAAMLQGFPRTYRFVKPGERVAFNRLGRLIGNAVPPPLAKAVGRAIIAHVAAHQAT